MKKKKKEKEKNKIDSYYYEGYYEKNNNKSSDEPKNKKKKEETTSPKIEVDYKYDNDYGDKNNENKNTYDDTYDIYEDFRKEKRRLSIPWKKLLIIAFLLVVLAGIGVFLYEYKNKVQEVLDPVEEEYLDVELFDTYLALVIGEEKKLNYQMHNKTDISLLTFSSTDPTVASIDNEGTVKALAAGEVVVTISYKGKMGDMSRTCTVTVIDPNETKDINEVTKEEQKVIDEIQKEKDEARKKQMEENLKIIEAAKQRAIKKALEEGQRMEEARRQAQNSGNK